MRWRCLLGHDWKEMACSSQTSLRWHTETVILFGCIKCCKYKTQTVKGSWKNDDDGPDNDIPPIPLTPDDFYASLMDEK